MDVRNPETTKPIVEHEDVTVYSMVPKWSMRGETMGSYLEFIDVFEIAPGAKAEPHYHDTHEFYFVLEGEGVVQIERETRRVWPGDLVHIPRNAVHSVWPTGDEPIRAFCFAVSYQEPGGVGYVPAKLPETSVDKVDKGEDCD